MFRSSSSDLLINLDLRSQLHSHLPTFPSHPPSSLTFLPNPTSPTSSLLAILLPSGNQLHLYSVEAKRFPSSLVLSSPDALRTSPSPALGLTVDPSDKAGSLLAWGPTWICRVRIGTGPVSKKAKQKAAKRAREGATAGETSIGGEGGDRFKVTHGFRPILGVSYVGERELAVVERPWLELRMPPSYFRGNKYGT